MVIYTESNSKRRRKVLIIPVLFTIFVAFLSIHIKSTSSQALKSFGEACNADCDERQLLACSKNNSVCECMQPNAMSYDIEQQKCVGRAGSPCIRYSANDFRCITHASCNKTSSYCNCDTGYFETENGTTCSLMAKFGDPCSSKRPCDRRSGMACLEKTSSSGRSRRTCQCMFPQDQYYDSSLNTCVSYAGGNCSFSLPCVRNAACSEDIYERRQGENMHGKSYTYNVTIGRKCACVKGTTKTKSRECMRGYMESCDDDSEEGNNCNPEENLKCYDSSICLCSNPLSQIYDEKMGKCVYLVGAKCNENAEVDGDKDSLCVWNAQCNAYSGRCECKEGYSTTPSNTCLKDFGSECQSGEVGCNFYRGLHCSHNACHCIDEQSLEYDVNSKVCLSREEMGCGSFEYDDSSVYLFGFNDPPYQTMTLVMGNHNRETIVGRVGGGNAPSIMNGNGLLRSQNGEVVNRSSHLPESRRKRRNIQIRCGEGLECVSEFSGETMQSGNDIFHGFCRKRQ